MRPSPGAAMVEDNGDAMKSGASGDSVPAAPGDGRTPPRHSPAVSDPLPAAQVLLRPSGALVIACIQGLAT